VCVCVCVRARVRARVLACACLFPRRHHVLFLIRFCFHFLLRYIILLAFPTVAVIYSGIRSQ